MDTDIFFGRLRANVLGGSGKSGKNFLNPKRQSNLENREPYSRNVRDGFVSGQSQKGI